MIRDVLEKALAFYDDHAWIQGQEFQSDEYGVTLGACLEGACAFTTRWGQLDVLGALMRSIRELFPERLPEEKCLQGVFQFNDHPLTTREDALLVLKHAIGKLDEADNRQEPAC